MKKRLVDLKVGDIVSLRINSNSKIKKYIYLGIDKEDIVSFDTLNLYMQLLKEGRMYFILLPYKYANNEEWTHNYIKYAPMQNLNHKYKVETDEELAKRITLAVVKRKNKKYVGKKLQSEEDISLNIKVRPKQITTLQGLVDMDKPIPVNTVPEAFESDALNHRGWAEIYGVKNVKKTNNHWYECEIDLEYLTHNLNTRFKVIRGGKTYPVSIPSITYPVLRSGDELLGYFNVDTDGTYRYNADYTDENDGFISQKERDLRKFGKCKDNNVELLYFTNFIFENGIPNNTFNSIEELFKYINS